MKLSNKQSVMDSCKHRQPMKAFGFLEENNSTDVQLSPQDSLAAGKSGTGYFLQFDNVEKKSMKTPKKSGTSTKKSSTLPKSLSQQPKKSSIPPKSLAQQPKRTVEVRKKPTTPPKKPWTPAGKSERPPGKAVASKNSTSTKTAYALPKPTSPSKLRSSAVPSTSLPRSFKKQGPAVKPKPDLKSRSKIPVQNKSTEPARGRAPIKTSNDGFRTRSVSPKVLKREHIVCSQREEYSTLSSVADKCDSMLKNLQQDRNHLEKALPVPKLVTPPPSAKADESDSSTSFLGQAVTQPVVSEISDKRTNNYSNNSFVDKADAAGTSRLVDTEPLNDREENNQVNNISAEDCRLSVESNNEVIGVNRANKSNVESDTHDILDSSAHAISTTRASVDHNIAEDLHQSTTGCQEQTNLTSSEGKNLSGECYWNGAEEAERDANVDNIDHVGIVAEERVIHLTRLKENEEVDLAQHSEQEHLESSSVSVTNSNPITMASSWMDRLKQVGNVNFIINNTYCITKLYPNKR